MNRLRFFLFALVGCVTCFASQVVFAAKPNVEGIRFFEKKIRPVLVKRCYKCHSSDAQKSKMLKGELLLDSRAGVRKGGESGPAVVPGDVKNSLLIQAIRHESLEMPPKSKLSDRVIADFVKWVKIGAPDPRDERVSVFPDSKINLSAGRKFWSFRPLENFSPPRVENTTWVRTPVDRFILAKQEAQQITPNEIASRGTLIRRVYFDLWGLPPQPAEVAAFVHDPASDAYEHLVDRLLGGEHYGERWARHWLDLARFAESNGYAFDKDRPAAYHYRDFVIKALNQDMPFDQFIRLQIAGDQIQPGSYMAQAATGFLAAGTFTSQQTQKERERSRYEQLDDIVSTIGTATLGLTLGCARCHDHKYDPVPRYDYYRMVATFRETGFQNYPLDLHPVAYQKARARFDKAHQPFVNARLKYEREQLPDRLAVWDRTRPAKVVPPKLGVWHVVGPFAAGTFDKAFTKVFPPEKTIDLHQTYASGKLKWMSRPGWTDGKVHNTLKGNNSANYLYRTIEVATAGPLEISLGRDDAIKLWINGKPVLSKKVLGAAAANQDKVRLVLEAGRNALLIKIVNASGSSGFYFQAQNNGPSKKIEKILAIASGKRTDKQRQELLKWFAPYDPQWRKLNDALLEHLKQRPQQDLLPIFAARKGGVTYNFGPNTRKVYFLARGNSNRKLGLASPGFLQVLMTDEKPGTQQIVAATANSPGHTLPPRVAFANWLTDNRHGAGPLLARVIVNRLWQHHFGRGIVGTPSDFGTQGERPTHPKLLDYLATRLIRGGWRLKPIQRLIMTSSVYLQGAKSTAAGMTHDPENKLWWRRPAQRLEAEIIRDAMLSVSGSLDTTMFGPGSLKQTARRRSIYLTVKRGSLIPILQLFDAPDAMQSIGQRPLTTVPPQALAMMNSPFVRQFAEKLARRVRPTAQTSLSRVVDDAFQIVLSRAPKQDERRRMLQFINGQATSYGGRGTGTERATADFCQLMMCLDEFVFVD